MKRKPLKALAGLYLLCILPFGVSLAQQAAPGISTSPLVEQLLRAAPDGEQLVELSGYVGLSTPEMVRLYRNLSLSSYLEIPRTAIVHSVQEGDPKRGQTRLYVRGSATVVSAFRHNAQSLAASSRRAVGGVSARQFLTQRDGANPRDVDRCWDYVAPCLAGSFVSCLQLDACLTGALPSQ